MGRGAAPELDTERLRLRAWRDADVQAYEPILRDRSVTRYLGGGLRYRAKLWAGAAVAVVSDVEPRRAVGTMRRHWDEHGFGEWAVELKSSGELIGKLGLVHQDDWPIGPDKVEVGWTLASPHWGHGYATEGARSALGYAFGPLDLERVISILRHDNVRSQRVMEKLGMTRQGQARWRGFDAIWYAIDRGDRSRAEAG